MRRKLVPVLPGGVGALDRGGEREGVFLLLLALFALGALCGTLLGLYLPPGGLRDALGAQRQLSAGRSLWGAAQFFLLLLALSTSWLGVVLVPATAAVRGCLLGCSAAALYAAGGWRGLLCASLVSGVPSLLLVPAFLAVGCDAFFAARRLLPGRSVPGPSGAEGAGARLLLAGAAILAAAAYSAWLLPVLLGGAIAAG